MKSFLPHLIAVATLVCVAPALAENPVTNVKPDEAAKLLKEKEGIQAVDVRTPEEFGDGHIPGAKNTNVLGDDFKAAVAQLDAAKPVLVYCRSGGRSSRALMTFRELGFTQIFHLNEGLMSWEDAGLELEE